MRTTTVEFTGDPLVLRADDGAVTVSLPIKVTRYSGRRTIVVPQGIVVSTARPAHRRRCRSCSRAGICGSARSRAVLRPTLPTSPAGRRWTAAMSAGW